MRDYPSAQTAHVALDAIRDGVVYLRNDEARAILEVSSVNFGMVGAGEQEAILASFAALLNGLTFPVQILVRVLPVDLDGYVTDLERQALTLTDPLAALARDHALFLRRLTRHRTLLERRFYVVVAADESAARSRWRRPRRGVENEPDNTAPMKQLTARCDELARGLSRCGLSAHRLDDLALAQLFYACWCPELSRVQRLRHALTEYTALATVTRRERC